MQYVVQCVLLLVLLAGPALAAVPSKDRFGICVTNDDGYQAPGIIPIVATLKAAGYKSVLSVAPAKQASGSGGRISTSIGVSKPVVQDPETGIYGYDGTPADAAYLCIDMFSKLNGRQPQLLLSGANEGANMGSTVLISGTVGAAMSGSQRGIPSAAISNAAVPGSKVKDSWYKDAADFMVQVADAVRADYDKISSNATQQALLLNINWPAANKTDIKGAIMSTTGVKSDIEFGAKQTASGAFGLDIVQRSTDDVTGEVTKPDWVLTKQNYVTISIMKNSFQTADATYVKQVQSLLAPVLTADTAEKVTECTQEGFPWSRSTAGICGGADGKPAGTAQPLNILVTNDDGCKAATINILFDTLAAAGHKPVMVAPADDVSGSGAALTFAGWKVEKADPSREIFCVSTNTPGVKALPADTTFVGIAMMANRSQTVDLLVSGPNKGNNLGRLVQHSGTVGATSAASAIKGVPSIAVSSTSDAATNVTYAASADLIVSIIKSLQARACNGKLPVLSPPLWVNVNDPQRNGTAPKAEFTNQEQQYDIYINPQYNQTNISAAIGFLPNYAGGADPNGDITLVKQDKKVSITVFDGWLNLPQCAAGYKPAAALVDGLVRSYNAELAKLA